MTDCQHKHSNVPGTREQLRTSSHSLPSQNLADKAQGRWSCSLPCLLSPSVSQEPLRSVETKTMLATNPAGK